MKRADILRSMRVAGVKAAFALANYLFALQHSSGQVIDVRSGKSISHFRKVLFLTRDAGRLCYLRDGEIVSFDPLLGQETTVAAKNVDGKDALFAHQRVMAVFKHGENKILLSTGYSDEFVQFGAKLFDFKADFTESAYIDNFMFSRRFIAWYDHDCGFFGVRVLYDTCKAAACRLLDGVYISDEFYDGSGASMVADVQVLRDAVWPAQTCAPKPNIESFVALSTGCADTSGTASCDSSRALEHAFYSTPDNNFQWAPNGLDEAFTRCLNGSVSTIREDSDGACAGTRAREFRYFYQLSQERLMRCAVPLQTPSETADELFRRIAAFLDGY